MLDTGEREGGGGTPSLKVACTGCFRPKKESLANSGV